MRTSTAGRFALRENPVSKVRIARVQDWPSIEPMARKFYDTTSYVNTIPYDKDTVQQLYLDMMKNGFIVVGEVDGVIVGMLGIMVVPFTLNRNYKVGTEIMWWVEPEYRHSRVALEMLDITEQVAKVDGCHLLSMSALDTSPPGVVKVYEKRGYKLQESSFTKEL